MIGPWCISNVKWCDAHYYSTNSKVSIYYHLDYKLLWVSVMSNYDECKNLFSIWWVIVFLRHKYSSKTSASNLHEKMSPPQYRSMLLLTVFCQNVFLFCHYMSSFLIIIKTFQSEKGALATGCLNLRDLSVLTERTLLVTSFSCKRFTFQFLLFFRVV